MKLRLLSFLGISHVVRGRIPIERTRPRKVQKGRASGPPSKGVIIMTSMIPYNNFERALFRNFPSMLDNIFDTALTGVSDGAFRMDVEDAGDAYVVTAELPGVTRDQIDVELHEGRLSISIDKKESDEQKGKNYLHKETCEWSATRGVYLKDAATAGLTAKLTDGMLTVCVPKQDEKANVTKITIE